MKIRLCISDPRWIHVLKVKRDPQGRYYVFLATKAGERVPGAPFVGGFESIDWIVANAATLHADLLSRLILPTTQPTNHS